MKNIISAFVLLLLFSSCSKEILTAGNTPPTKVYEEFWQHVEEHYIYFDEKNVDWDSVYQVYRPSVTDDLSDEELLQVMENSLLELRDAHNTIRTPLRRAKSFQFTAGYEVHFSLDVVEAKYIDGDFATEKIFSYGNIDDRTIYIHIPQMQQISSLQKLIRNLVTDSTKNIILDVRGNSGGDSNPVPQLLGDFVKEKTLLGSYIEKSGPLRTDETNPIPIYAEPSSGFQFDFKVFVLQDRQGYSATSYLAAMCKGLSNFTLVGQITGGGGGGNADYELSNGWIVAVSVSDFLDKDGRTIELGVAPDVEVENSAEDISNEMDKMLEKVLELAH